MLVDIRESAKISKQGQIDEVPSRVKFQKTETLSSVSLSCTMCFCVVNSKIMHLTVVTGKENEPRC